jgi:microcystin-dependent protein
VATAGIADSAVTSAKIADGTIVLADLAAALQAFLVPVGTIAMYGGASAPTGWLLCDGTSTTGYTALAAIVGANTPDLRGRFAIGDNASLTLLGTGGSATIAEANLPSHTHTFSATSGSSTTGITLSTTGAHVHTINGEGFVANVQDVLNGDGQRVLESDLSTSASTEDTASAGDHTHTVTDSGHTHSVSGTTGNGSGSGTAYYQPYLVVNYIIKHD